MYNFEMNKLSQIALAWKLYKNNTPIVIISQTLEVYRETVGIWIIRTKKNPDGITGFLDQYINAKKGERRKRKIDGLLKAKIFRIREKIKIVMV